MKIVLIALIVLASQMSFADECIQRSKIRSFNVIDSHTVEIRTVNKYYALETRYCPGLEWAQQIGFDTFNPTKVCSADRLLILDNFSNQVTTTCFIDNIFQTK